MASYRSQFLRGAIEEVRRARRLLVEAEHLHALKGTIAHLPQRYYQAQGFENEARIGARRAIEHARELRALARREKGSR